MYTSIESSLPAVERIWFGDSNVDPRVGHRSEPVLGADLVFTFREGDVVIRLQGPLTVRRTYPWSANARYLGIRLTPGSGRVLIDHSLCELQDTSEVVAKLWGTDLHELGGQLANSSNDEDMLARAEGMVAAIPVLHIARHPLVAECLRLICESRGTARIEDIAHRAAVSRRTLQRLIKAHLGLSPKSVSRLVRLESFRRLAGIEPDLGRLAACLGFADQSHLSREVRRTYGTTASQLAADNQTRYSSSPSR